MKITGLRLIGFKSFVDSSDLVVEPGLTGIVGPNGCGKSNLVEALRFVMGESSYKAMRGGGMDDVIFAGSAGRPGRNSAEVTLFARQTRPLMDGAAGDALEITRRIEREAGSAYRVNGREARARDVQILFADAATGARSSALVRQGQIGEIIAAKPTQRRAILEDAAGISGLHARRHEAELKLKGAEQNLERLEDVLAEISGQLETLRRQARQAVRYRTISGDIRKSEAALYFVRWRAAEERLSEAQAALGAATSAVAEAATAQAAAAREEAVAGERLPELRRRAAEAGAALQRMQQAAQELERREAELRARRAELAERAGQARDDLSREAEIGEEGAAALAALDEEAAALAAERQRDGEGEAAARARAAEAAEAVARSEAALGEVTGALARLAAERAALERARQEGEARTERLRRQRQEMAAEQARIKAERDGDTGSDAARADFDKALQELEQAEEELNRAQATVAAARDAEQAARGPREAAERALAALETEARTLSRMLDGGQAERFPPLVDSLDVAPGYEQALAAALGDDLDASLDPSAPRAWAMPGSGEADPPLPQGVAPLSDFVRGPAELARRLAQIGVQSGDGDGQLLAQRLAPGQRLVTQAGDLWRWDGMRASAGAPTAAAQRLEQRNRLAALETEIEAARTAAAEARRAETDCRDARAAAEAQRREAQLAADSARTAADHRRETLRQAESRAARAEERLSALAAALQRIDADRDEAAAALEEACASLAGLPPADQSQCEQERLRSRLDAERAEAAEARAAAESMAQAERARASRLSAIEGERRRWRERAERAETRTTELRQRLESLEAEGRRLEEEPASLAERRARLMDEIAAAEAAARSADDAVASADSEHRRLAEAARAALEALSAARETRAREEERVAAAEQRRAELAGQIRDTFDRAPHELRELAELKPEAPLPDPGTLESRVERLRSERERLGAVNLRAEQEADEVARRLDELASERADLDGAVKKLRHGIHSLNREARERLLAAFEVVNGHFQSLFTHLFGGGSAELMLTESDDPLGAGLEIMARPPGKKPQIMTLLSGGEQALTALSLVFAVFLTNPSPICVLDEVDAPLDDANVERFCVLLEDMRRRTDTRFLVVTHNPITMARMDRLFGVTMAERGVSQLVSVDLETAEGFREAG